MPPWRRLSRSLVLPAVAACWAVGPPVADAAVTVPAVPGRATTALNTAQSVGAAAPAAQQVGEDVARAVEPAVSGAVTPAPPAGESPVEQTVAPMAGAAGATVPSAAAAVPQVHLAERARASVARVAASASAERLSARPSARRQSSHGVARQRPSVERPASLQGAALHVTSAATARDAAATPSRSTLESSESGFGFQAGSAAAGAAAGFFFGGALALLVATLLLAGPRLRRHLPVLPAVCRPAAFLVVLERPG